MIPPLDIAFKYTEESISKCRQLAEFLKKRQEIEEEYAKSLRKLCKSVSLRPMKKQSWFSRRTQPKADEGQDDIQTLLMRTNLWSTFYELVDDTSQIAKAHGILAESISTQLITPFEESIKNMDLNRKRVGDETSSIHAELQEASAVLKKAKQQLEESTNEVNSSRLALSRIEGAITVKPRDLERAKTKYQTATDKLSIARASYRQCDEVCRALQNKVQSVDVPRITRMLSGLESSRGQEARQVMQSAMRLDRLTAEMDLQCTSLMESKVAEVVLDDALDSLMAVNQPSFPSTTSPVVSTAPLAAGEETRRYSITRPLINGRPAEISAHLPGSRAINSVQNGSAYHAPNSTAHLNASPSYYPNTQIQSSADALNAKKSKSQNSLAIH